MVESGYLGLFATAFLAATLIPVSSEVVLGALTAAEGFDIWLLVAVATAGNTLGSVINWLLGRYCLNWRDKRWFPIKPASLVRATERFNRYGLWSMLFAWLPIVGDPLTFAAGVLGVRFRIFVTLVAIGKATRYIAVAFLAQQFL
ncbi:MAG: DedA family protein [Alphaproteobacteria bacterium]|nr:DedA family protein [Alphaproteobacteria bacterium]